MEQGKDSSAWLDHFERNRLGRPEPDWGRPTPFPPAVVAPLARSLAHFALGERCEGTTLLADARRHWPDDPDYVAAMTLFVAEEREHARLLDHLVTRYGGGPGPQTPSRPCLHTGPPPPPAPRRGPHTV